MEGKERKEHRSKSGHSWNRWNKEGEGRNEMGREMNKKRFGVIFSIISLHIGRNKQRYSKNMAKVGA